MDGCNAGKQVGVTVLRSFLSRIWIDVFRYLFSCIFLPFTSWLKLSYSLQFVYFVACLLRWMRCCCWAGIGFGLVHTEMEGTRLCNLSWVSVFFLA